MAWTSRGATCSCLSNEGRRVPQMMDLDDPDAIALTDPAERTDEVARLKRPSAAGREHQAGVLPSIAERDPVNSLLGLADLQCLTREIGDRKVAVPSASLDRPLMEFTTDSL